MFPRSSLIEVRHCLAVADGDVERAAQIVLHRQEAGQSISHSANLLQVFQPYFTCSKHSDVINEEQNGTQFLKPLKNKPSCALN